MVGKKLEYYKYCGNEDFSYFSSMVTNDEIMQMNMGRAFTTEESIEYYHFMLSNAELYKVFAVSDSNENVYIGTVSMRVLKEEKEVEIEYMLLPDFWGFGYGTEIVKHLVELAMKNNCICSISAITDKKNIRSKRVLVKNGFKLERSFIVEGENRIAEKFKYLSSD